jgi:hypothetical protein
MATNPAPARLLLASRRSAPRRAAALAIAPRVGDGGGRVGVSTDDGGEGGRAGLKKTRGGRVDGPPTPPAPNCALPPFSGRRAMQAAVLVRQAHLASIGQPPRRAARRGLPPAPARLPPHTTPQRRAAPRPRPRPLAMSSATLSPDVLRRKR